MLFINLKGRFEETYTLPIMLWVELIQLHDGHSTEEFLTAAILLLLKEALDTVQITHPPKPVAY